MKITIILNDRGNPPGKVADAELVFEPGEPLAGLKSIGWAVWQRRDGSALNVTHPARQYAVNGERRSFALIRPAGDAQASADALRQQIIDAYHAHVQQAELAVLIEADRTDQATNGR